MNLSSGVDLSEGAVFELSEENSIEFSIFFSHYLYSLRSASEGVILAANRAGQ